MELIRQAFTKCFPPPPPLVGPAYLHKTPEYVPTPYEALAMAHQKELSPTKNPLQGEAPNLDGGEYMMNEAKKVHAYMATVQDPIGARAVGSIGHAQPHSYVPQKGFAGVPNQIDPKLMMDAGPAPIVHTTKKWTPKK